MEMAPRLVKIVEHSTLILNNQRYNKLIQSKFYNLNKIKAIMHNNVIINLTNKLTDKNFQFDNIIIDALQQKINILITYKVKKKYLKM